MNHSRFDALLSAARPKQSAVDADFTDTVMNVLRTSEIFSSQLRRMSVNKKETLFMKLRHLPKFAVIAIAIGALLLVSGTAFAAYQLLWPKPVVHVSQPTTVESGRQQVALSTEQCGASTLAEGYELKSNATITAAQVPGVVQARCELDAIGTWSSATFPHDKRGAPLNTKEHDSVMLNTSMATHIKDRTADSITFVGLTKYNQTDKTLPTTAATRYIADGHDITADQISADDPIVYITTETYRIGDSSNCGTSCSIPSAYVSTTLYAVVKLSLPFENYDQFAWQSLSEVNRCQGNPDDVCLSGFVSAIDLYGGGFNAAYADESKGTILKEVQGVITKLDGTTTVFRSSSGTLFTLETHTDFIHTFNTEKATQYYNGLTVKVGSRLMVGYVEAVDEHSRTINPSHLKSVQLQLEGVGKSDPAKAY